MFAALFCFVLLYLPACSVVVFPALSAASFSSYWKNGSLCASQRVPLCEQRNGFFFLSFSFFFFWRYGVVSLPSFPFPCMCLRIYDASFLSLLLLVRPGTGCVNHWMSSPFSSSGAFLLIKLAHLFLSSRRKAHNC